MFPVGKLLWFGTWFSSRLTKTKLETTWFVAGPSVDPLETRNVEIKNTFTSLNCKKNLSVGFGSLRTSFPLNTHNLIHKPHLSSILLYYSFSCPLNLSSVKHSADHNTFKTGQYWGRQSIQTTHTHDSLRKNMSWQQHSWGLRDGVKQN